MIIKEIYPEDIAQCAEIYNYYVLNTRITLEEESVSVSEFSARAERITKKYPYIVAKEGEKVIGYAYLDAFNPRSAYKITADLSIYTDKDRQHEGIGKKLLDELCSRAKAMKIEKIVSLITSENSGSLGFHRKNGFTEQGRLADVAFKLGRYCDLVFMEKSLL